MKELKIGDIVGRKSYGQDILFKITDIICEGDKKKVVLKGICYRIEADAPEEDLILQTEPDIRDYNLAMMKKMNNKFRAKCVGNIK